MTTETEAKATRCCGPPGCGFTDPRQDDCKNGESWCIGSECMAWRKMPLITVPGSNTKMRPDGGYCGHAGKP